MAKKENVIAAEEVVAAEEVDQVAENVTPVTAPSQEGVSSEGALIAAAITEGIKSAVGEKNFVISADPTVEPRFAVVKNHQGEVMIRENATGHLSKVQLESIEEKEASIQNQEVTEV